MQPKDNSLHTIEGKSNEIWTVPLSWPPHHLFYPNYVQYSYTVIATVVVIVWPYHRGTSGGSLPNPAMKKVC